MANNTVSKHFGLHTLLNSIPDTGTVNSVSSVQDIKAIMGYSVQHVWTAGSASRAAVITLSGSFTQTGTFTVIDSYTLDGSAGDRMINVEFPRYNYIQVAYVNSSGIGGGTVTSTVTTRVV